MEDCTESHQSQINRKIKANRQTEEHLTSMQEEDSAYLRRQFSVENAIDRRREGSSPCRQKTPPTLARSERKTKIYLDRISKDIERKQQDTSGNLAEMDRGRPGIGACQCQTDSTQARNGVFGGRASSGNCQSCKPRVFRGPTTSDRLHVRQSGTTNHPLSVQVCSRDAKQRLQHCVGTAHGGWSDGRGCQESQPDCGTHRASAGSRDHASQAWPRGAQAPVRGSVYRRRVLFR